MQFSRTAIGCVRRNIWGAIHQIPTTLPEALIATNLAPLGILTILLVAFPEIALFLPDTMIN